MVLAVVTGAHGVGGEVRLKVFADDLSAFTRFNDGTLTRTALRGDGAAVIARFAEVPDRTAAEALRGMMLTVPRSALPPLEDGEFYHADLIGLAAVTPDGTAVGVVTDVANFGAGDIVEIARHDGGSVMVPLTRAAVPDWNDERLVVDPGWLG